ncbi:hypothetical protein ACFLWB_02800 [Chloroflexota bacterium]
MIKSELTPTKDMFDSLAKLYKQGQLLLLDADRIMGERGWETKTTTVFQGLSYSLNSPDKWYIRWAARFYYPVKSAEDEPMVQHIPFISVHFKADHDTELDEPVASAGWLLYAKQMTIKEAQSSQAYWMCKYWFYGEPQNKTEGWRKTGQSHMQKNLKGTETFAVALYSITSREKLEKLVIDTLFSKYQVPSDNP